MDCIAAVGQSIAMSLEERSKDHAFQPQDLKDLASSLDGFVRNKGEGRSVRQWMSKYD